MVYRLVFTEIAEKDLVSLDKSIQKTIIGKLDYFLALPDPFAKAKKLKGFNMYTYRFRVGDYRMLFRKDLKTNELIILVIIKIGHRKGVYRKN